MYLPGSIRTSWSESSLIAFFASSLYSVRKRESDVVIMEFSDISSSAIFRCNFLNINNLDTSGSNSMSSSHIQVKLIYSTNTCGITIFLVEIVSS
mmetsp:Transcript_8090/g.23138  ORF Transcript_8090/g.23138 Transcript_8090/m.23138 type:complete len:95 (-) Transcript_8090:246-530(-)